MIRKVEIPTIDTNVEEATLTRWLKKEGDRVRKGEPLVELTTEKAAFEFEAPRSGLLRKILAEEKSIVPVGYVIALIGEANDPLPDVMEANRRLLERRQRRSAASARPAREAAGGGPSKVRATPAARRLAKEKGVDLAAVGSKAGVDIVRETDVIRFLQTEA